MAVHLRTRAAADRGASEILSVHIGSSVSGTVNAARLGAHVATLPLSVIQQLANHPLTDLGIALIRRERPRYVYSTKDPHRAQKKGLLCGASSGSNPMP